MEPKPKTCIVCNSRADSGEHLFPACVGGLRENNKIYCQKHNSDYGSLANELAEQLCFFNAQFGIRNTRTRQVRPVELKGENGLVYEYDGTTLKLKGVQSLSAGVDTQSTYVTSDPAEAKRMIDSLKAQGINVDAPVSQRYHPGRLGKQVSFGGPIGLRAIAYVAQTFFAHCFPVHARNAAMKPFIDYTLNGNGQDYVWWDFAAPSETANAYTLGHRVTVGIDAEARQAYARVSLYSTLDFAMVFYTFDSDTELSSTSVRNDIDPAAVKMPDDLRQAQEAYAISPVRRPGDPTASLRSSIESGEAQRRQTELMRRASEFRIARDAAALSTQVNRANSAEAKQTIVRDFWADETQRILLLLEEGLAGAEQQNNDPARPVVSSTLQTATRRDVDAPSGLTPEAEAAIAVAARALTKAMLKDLAAGRLDDSLIRRYIGEGLGVSIAVKAILIDKNVVKETPSLRQTLLNSSCLTQTRYS